MTRRLSASRIAAAFVLGAWAFLFWFLLATGRTPLYLSTRTAWLVPLGAALTTIGMVGRLASARVDRPREMDRRGWWTMSLLVAPVVLLVSLPPATLGTFAVGRRASFVGAGVSSSGDLSSGLSFLNVAAAQSTKEGQRQLRAHAGDQVTFEGFVTKEGDEAPGEFLLTRWIVTCCVADATIAQVRVVDAPPGSYDNDQWYRVTGSIYPLGTDVLVDASKVESIPLPSHPYMTP